MGYFENSFEFPKYGTVTNNSYTHSNMTKIKITQTTTLQQELT